jgi:zinc/manganese transport system substrate-binding protein
VVATVSDLAWLATEIGGDRVTVASICAGHQDPHYVEAKPSYAKLLRDADLLVYVGLELEVGWLPRLLDTARNPELKSGSARLFEAAKAVPTILEVPTGGVDRSQGDIHPFGNPHVLLDPRDMFPIGEALAQRLIEIDPEGAADYERNLGTWRERFTLRLAEWNARATSLRGVPIVGFHKQWEYLADWLGLDIVGYVEDRPGIPPAPRHLSALIETMKARNAKIVLAATFNDQKAAGEVAKRAGANLVVLPAAVGGTEGTDTYEALIGTILDRLVAARS